MNKHLYQEYRVIEFLQANNGQVISERTLTFLEDYGRRCYRNITHGQGIKVFRQGKATNP